MANFSFRILYLIMIALSLFCSCTEKRSTWQFEELFFLNLGIMEDELDFFERDGTLIFDQKMSFLMRDGIFYISNPSLGKIMKFSSYGDILSLIYSEKYNPPFKKNAANFRVNTWDFRDIGALAVDSQGRLYIDDRIEINTSLSEKLFFDRIVLRFNNDGQYEDFLGRDGKQGLPFSSVQNLQIVNNDKLFIMSRTEEFWQIHCYDAQKNTFDFISEISGSLLNQAGKSQTEFRIDSVISAYAKNILIICATGLTETKTEVLQRLFVYDIETKVIIQSFLFPLGKQGESFEFIGSDKQQYLYFVKEISNENNTIGYELHILNSDGKLFEKTLLPNKTLELPISAVLKVSDQSIIYALLVYDSGAQVLWWKPPDLLFKEHDNTHIGYKNTT